MALPIIAIIGRPNVGKSTLFNRLIGARLAVTSSIPGTTRDRIYHEADIGTYRIILADTGGMEFEKKVDIEADVQMQAKIAVEDADLIYFVIDATEPLLGSDLDAAQYLRKSKKPIILIANKADNKKSDAMLPQLYELGFGESIPVSPIHNLGILELEDSTKKVLKKMKWKKETPKKQDFIDIAIVGKPNVGKSSIVNALLGKARLIVSDKPGTTIDATDTPFSREGQNYCLIDTAGLRRRGKVGKGIERLGVLRALQAISRSDVACLVMDCGMDISNQDLHVSQYILEAGKGLVIVINKEDLMENRFVERKKILDTLQYRMSYAPWAPVIFASAKTKKNIFQILESSKNIEAERRKKIDQSVFSIFLKAAIASHPPARSGKKIVITKGSQTGTRPPAFTFFSNNPDLVHFSYRRFLENEIRRKFGFHGTVIKLIFKKLRF